MSDILLFLWPTIGIAAHVEYCLSQKTWCDIPIWEEPSTYLMFFESAIAGPFMLFNPKY